MSTEAGCRCIVEVAARFDVELELGWWTDEMVCCRSSPLRAFETWLTGSCLLTWTPDLT